MKANSTYESLFRRHAANPILTAASWPYPAHTVFNPGATRLADGTTLLLCRVEDRRGHSHLCAARSANGIDNWAIDSEPTFSSDSENHPEESFGVEDPRITFVPELKKYVIAYTAYGQDGPGVALALTEDFRAFKRIGLIMPPDDKDAALLPRRIAGKFVLIHRPATSFGVHVWISTSPDLEHWGSPKPILRARKGGWWDANKVGLSCPPIETPRGWLVIYHGVRVTASGSLYRVGLALFDLEDPSRCILRGDDWVFGPQAPYEQHGDVGNVTFPCGATVADDGDTLNLYYGGADSCVALATASIRELLGWLDRHGSADIGAPAK
ncbi:MAG: glycosidase [Polyangiaceae bacterium]